VLLLVTEVALTRKFSSRKASEVEGVTFGTGLP